MKTDIHPEYSTTAIKCACGNVLEAGSTKKDIRVEICSKCHPFSPGNRNSWTLPVVSSAFARNMKNSRISSEGYPIPLPFSRHIQKIGIAAAYRPMA